MQAPLTQTDRHSHGWHRVRSSFDNFFWGYCFYGMACFSIIAYLLSIFFIVGTSLRRCFLSTITICNSLLFGRSIVSYRSGNLHGSDRALEPSMWPLNECEFNNDALIQFGNFLYKFKRFLYCSRY